MPASTSTSTSSEGGGVPILSFNLPKSISAASTKRKRPSSPQPKPNKNPKHTKESKQELNPEIANLSPRALASYMLTQTRRFQPDLTTLELEELTLPVERIRDTTAWKDQRVAGKLPDFIRYLCGSEALSTKKGASRTEERDAPRTKKGGQPAKEDAPPSEKAAPPANNSSPHTEKGAPHTLIISSSGLRSADLYRALRGLKGEKVVKLFAKHIKLAEAREVVRRTGFGVGVGTPRRMLDLVRGGELRTNKLERVIVDASFRDQKQKGVLEIRETCGALGELVKELEGVEVVFF